MSPYAHTHMRIFGQVVDGEMRLNRYGEVLSNTWNDLTNHINGIELGPFVVMPNHIHGIIAIIDTAGIRAGLEPAPTPAGLEPTPTPTDLEPAPTPAGLEPTPTPTGLEPVPTPAGLEPAPTPVDLGPVLTPAGLPEIVRQLKTFSARRINTLRSTPGKAVWQRGYWDHIIRDDQSRLVIGEYIIHKAGKWEEDRLFSGKR